MGNGDLGAMDPVIKDFTPKGTWAGLEEEPEGEPYAFSNSFLEIPRSRNIALMVPDFRSLLPQLGTVVLAWLGIQIHIS